MTTMRRIQNEPAWLLHHRPFRDSSRILEVLSREHGRLSLVARGSRSAGSRLKGILRPFMPLELSWVMRSELGTLTGAEVHGAPVTLRGDALLAAYYLNELLLNLLHRHDPQPEVFDAYAATMRSLARDGNVAARLREFELALLRILGYELNLDRDAESRETLVAEEHYEYRIEQGPVRTARTRGGLVFSGEVLAAIGARSFDRPEVLLGAGRLLKRVIAFHLDGRELKTRKVLRELRRAPRIKDNAGSDGQSGSTGKRR
ncbi:MAG: DNA repair protein RecO [Woeseiaceae bacterium]